MNIGAQLWLFQSILDESEMAATLATLKDAGYDCIESMFGRPPQSLETLNQIGMSCYATHTSLSARKDPAEGIQFCHRIGAKVVCISGLLEWNERTADDYRRSAAALNTLGAQLREVGLSLQYHNHDFEFELVEGESTGMDLLISTLDPNAVSLCFDAGWARYAGADPVQFLLRHKQIVTTLHLRDFKGKTSVALGDGDHDLKSIFDALPSLPALNAIMVEQDPGTSDPVGDMVKSRKLLADSNVA